MTTYTTPHFATGVSDRNLRTEPSINRARPASAAPYRTAGVSNEAAMLADGPTPDWQPGVAKGGVPKAAVGALGAALVGGVALAIVLMAPSNKVVKHVSPDPIAQATAQNAAAQKSVDSSTAAVNELEKNPPAAGDAAATTDTAAKTDTTTTTATTTTKTDAVPAPVQAVIPHAPPVVNAPVAREHHARTPVATPRVTPQPVQSAPVVTPAAPVVTPDAPVATPPADVQAPAMQQTPEAPTVTPAPTPDTPSPAPDTPSPAPAPAPTE